MVVTIIYRSMYHSNSIQNTLFEVELIQRYIHIDENTDTHIIHSQRNIIEKCIGKLMIDIFCIILAFSMNFFER